MNVYEALEALEELKNNGSTAELVTDPSLSSQMNELVTFCLKRSNSNELVTFCLHLQARILYKRSSDTARKRKKESIFPNQKLCMYTTATWVV